MHTALRLAPLLLAAGLAACATPGTSKTPLVTADAAPLAAQALAGNGRAAPSSGWWKDYGDAQLDGLVAQALIQNPNLAAVQARLDRASAIAQAAGAVRLPSLNANAQVPYQRTSANGTAPPSVAGRFEWNPAANLSLSFELDFWGKNRAALASALSAEAAASLEAADARLALVSNVVAAYVNFDRVHGQREFALALLAAREQQLKLTEQRFQAGLDTRVEAEQARSLVAQSRAEVAAWQEQVELASHQIAALVGSGPAQAAMLTRPRLANPQFGLPENLPAAWLGQRPDIAAARSRIEAAASDIRAAHAQFYPNINLTAFAGLASYGLANFAEAGSFTAGVTPAISLPIFDAGKLRANLRLKEADRDAAIAAYNGALVQGLREVADALSQLRSANQQLPELEQSAAAANEALKLARLRYERGLGNYLQVLIAEGQYIAQERSRLDIAAKTRTANALLARAIGGGHPISVATTAVAAGSR